MRDKIWELIFIREWLFDQWIHCLFVGIQTHHSCVFLSSVWKQDRQTCFIDSVNFVPLQSWFKFLSLFVFCFVKTLAVCLCFLKAFCYLGVFVLCFFRKQPGLSQRNWNRVSLAAPIKRVSWNQSLSTRLWLVLSWISNDFAHFC